MKPPISHPRQVAARDGLGMLAICLRNLIDLAAGIAGTLGDFRLYGVGNPRESVSHRAGKLVDSG